MNDQNITISQAEHADIPSLCNIQRAALPCSLMVRCGEYFLRKAMYQIAITNPGARIFTIKNEQRNVGFIIYGQTPLFFKQHLSKKKVPLLISLSMQLHTDPLVFFKCVQIKNKSHIVDTVSLPKTCFHLFLIAIEPQKHGFGYGSKLLNGTFGDVAKYYNSNTCLVEARTRAAYNFYKQNSFYDVGYELRGKNKFYRLFKNI